MKTDKFYKLLLAIILLMCFNGKVLAQSNFDNGFKAGFKNGYCYSNQTSGTCYPPLPPSPPLPQINESSDSYKDGYNRGFLYGTAQRKDDDNHSSSSRTTSSNYPKFNQYVPQSPILSLTPDEREAYYAARARQDQETAVALGNLLESVFTVNPEKKARRETNRTQRRMNRALRFNLDKHAKKMQKEIDKSIRKSHKDSKF